MAITYPIPLDDFFGQLSIEHGARFYLPGVREHSRTRGGEILSAQRGNSLWRCEVTAITRATRDLMALQGKLELLDRTGGSFLARALPACGPAADRDGAIISTAAPKVRVYPNNRTELGLKDLPGGYVLTSGDLLSIKYGEKYSLHRLLENATATQNGTTSAVAVNPPIPLGVAQDDPVTLYRPVIKALLVPGEVRWPSYGAGFGRVSFELIQTMG